MLVTVLDNFQNGRALQISSGSFHSEILFCSIFIIRSQALRQKDSGHVRQHDACLPAVSANRSTHQPAARPGGRRVVRTGVF
jgi:hypothetical protein